MNYTPSIETTNAMAQRYSEFASRFNLQQSSDALSERVQQLNSRPLRLVIVGEIKKGKSTFINTLIGETEITPTASDIATSTVYRITYASRPGYRVHFQTDEDGLSRDPISISKAQVPEYGTEDMNPGNEKNVDHIEIQVTSDFLGQGVELVDTPGLGGLFRKHAVVTWKHVPSADAIIFVLDSKESVMTRDEVEYLEKISKLNKPVFFVQTMIDLANRETWAEWRDRNKEIISKALGRPLTSIRYFPVSSKLMQVAQRRDSEKHRSRSGFPQLLSFIDAHMLPALRAREGGRIITEMVRSLRAIQKNLKDTHKILTQGAKEQLAEMEGDLRTQQREFKSWRDRDYKQAMRTFKNDFVDLRTRYKRELQSQMSPKDGSIILRSLEPLIEKASKNEKQIDRNSEMISQRCLEICVDQARELIESFQEDCSELVKHTIHRVDPDAVIPEFRDQDHDICSMDPRGVSLTYNAALAEGASMGMQGLMVGSAVSGGLIGLGLATNPVGWVAGIALGLATITQRYQAKSSRREQEIDKKLRHMITQIVRDAASQTAEQFTDLSTQYERSLVQVFDTMVEDKQSSLEQLMEEIQSTRQRNSSENKAKAKEVQDQMTEIQSFIHELVGSSKREAARS